MAMMWVPGAAVLMGAAESDTSLATEMNNNTESHVSDEEPEAPAPGAQVLNRSLVPGSTTDIWEIKGGSNPRTCRWLNGCAKHDLSMLHDCPGGL